MKQLGFHLTFKTADLQDIIYATLGDDIKVKFDQLFLYVALFIPDAQTQLMFDDSIKNSFSLSFHSWTSDRKAVDTQLEHQVDIGSAQNINSPKDLIVAQQTAAEIGVSNKANNTVVFDNLDVSKYHLDIDGVRHPRDGVSIDYASNDYVDQYHDLKLIFKEYLGEALLNPFINYIDMRNRYPIQVIDLRYPVDHINPKKFNCINTIDARLFMIVIRQKEIKVISDGNKFTEVTII